MKSSQRIKLTLSMTAKDAQTLYKIQTKLGLSSAETIRKGLQLMSLYAECDKSEAQFMINTKDNNIRIIVL